MKRSDRDDGESLRAVTYARVSTQEQTRGNYPSCASQLEELRAYCREQGYEVTAEIQDPGYSVGSLKRPGLARLRELVTSKQADCVLCTWYDRLIRTREFFILDQEFRAHGVKFVTLHDKADRDTAAGRFMEHMLVGAKAYDREQTGEKVSLKLRMRAEKGMWNGGAVPFGFVSNQTTQKLDANPDTSPTVLKMFQVYVATASDYKVREWLQTHQIPSPSGQPVWTVSTIRDVLMNPRYVGGIEINKKNRGRRGVPEQLAYQLLADAFDPLIPMELFDQAQVIRREKALLSPNRRGRPKSYSRNQCGRVYPLQGRFYCATCGHAMTPYYVQHKPNLKEKRRSASRIHYYTCSNTHKNGPKVSEHKNRVLSEQAETQILQGIWRLAATESVIETALEGAMRRLEGDLSPETEALKLTNQALLEVEAQINNFLTTIGQGKANNALLALMNEKVDALTQQRERLNIEKQQRLAALEVLRQRPDAAALRDVLSSFSELAEEAEPEELQRLMRLIFNRIEWLPDGSFWVEIHHIPKSRHDSQESHLEKWFVTNERNGCPGRIRTSDPSVNSRLLYR